MDSLKLESRLNELSSLIDRISGQEISMRDLAENHDKVERMTIQKFAEWTISPETTAVPAMIEQIHTIIVGSPNLDYIGQKSLLVQLGVYLEVSRSNISFFYMEGKKGASCRIRVLINNNRVPRN